MENNLQLLEKMYQSAAGTAYNFQKISEKSDDKNFYDLIEKQRLATENLSHSIERELISFGEMPSEPKLLAKCDINCTIFASTLTDSSASRLAEITVNQLEKEIIALTTAYGEYTSDDPKIKDLLDQLIELDKNHIQALKSHI